jgi:hypothetical protein
LSAAAQALDGEGRVWFRNALNEAELSALDDVCQLGGARGARISATSRVIAALQPVDGIAAALLPGARPVRVVAFNKAEAANWALPWHQDRVIAVRERADAAGFSNWTRKSGVWHVEPPIGLLERMLFLRVHLDAADAANGCLDIAPGTHALGMIAADQAERIAMEAACEPCIAERGDVLAASALILHRSGASRSGASRRALRIDYSAETLPSPLEWEFDA